MLLCTGGTCRAWTAATTLCQDLEETTTAMQTLSTITGALSTTLTRATPRQPMSPFTPVIMFLPMIIQAVTGGVVEPMPAQESLDNIAGVALLTQTNGTTSHTHRSSMEIQW